MTIIRFRRGNKADLPTSAPGGMPLWCEDTKQLYLGTGDNVHLIGENQNIAGDLVPYSVNSGNTDSNGYADLINKVSETSVSFKVGGIYPNMGITFPNGSHYIVSSIPNITNLAENVTYLFVIYEESLVLLEDGTYSAIVSAMEKRTLTEDIKFPEDYEQSIVPAKTADTGDGSGWTASAAEYSSSFYPWNAFDNADGIWVTTFDAISWLKIQKDSGTFNLSRIAITADSTYYRCAPGDFTVKDQSDNVLASFTGQVFAPEETKYFNVTANDISAVKIDVTAVEGGPSSGVAIKELKLYSNVTSGDGDLLLLINQKPLKPYLRQSSSWIEKQFVKIGEVQKLSGLLGTPISYAFNGYFYEKFSWSKNTIISRNHNIGTTNLSVEALLYCKVANNGYAVGDITTPEVDLHYGTPAVPTIRNNSLFLYITVNDEGLYVNPAEVYQYHIGANQSNWDLIFVARRRF